MAFCKEKKKYWIKVSKWPGDSLLVSFNPFVVSILTAVTFFYCSNIPDLSNSL